MAVVSRTLSGYNLEVVSRRNASDYIIILYRGGVKELAGTHNNNNKELCRLGISHQTNFKIIRKTSNQIQHFVKLESANIYLFDYILC